MPLAVALSAANVHDSQLLEPLVDAVPPIWRPVGEPGRPRRRPAKLHGDKGYDYPVLRRALRRRGIAPRIARRGVESRERLGRYRWTVERTVAWLLAFRRELRLPAPPPAVQRLLVGALAALGRLRGYRGDYPYPYASVTGGPPAAPAAPAARR